MDSTWRRQIEAKIAKVGVGYLAKISNAKQRSKIANLATCSQIWSPWLSVAWTFTVCSDIFLGQQVDNINLALFENKYPICKTTTGDTNSDFEEL